MQRKAAVRTVAFFLKLCTGASMYSHRHVQISKAFASSISRLTGAVYLFAIAFAVLEAAPALGQLLLDAEGLELGCGSHWVVPSLSSAVTNLALALYVWRSAVKVTQKCECATSFANHVLSLTSYLPMAERQGLVLHLQLSDAGIRVSGMKITGAVMLKMLSVLTTVVTGLLDGIVLDLQLWKVRDMFEPLTSSPQTRMRAFARGRGRCDAAHVLEPAAAGTTVSCQDLLSLRFS